MTLLRETANIHSEKHNILVFLSNTLFSPFYVPSPSLFLISKNGRYLGGTWEERFRFTFVTSSLSNRYQSEVLSKTKRSSIEVLSKIYRRPIEDLSNIYRTSIEDLSKTYRRPIEDGVKRERRGSGEGAEEGFGYKVTKLRSLIFTFLVVSVT